MATSCAICSAPTADPIQVGRQRVCRPCLERVSAEVDSRRPGRRTAMKIRDGKQIAGVCGGLADAMNMDQDTLRVLTVLACVVTGIVPVLAAYLVLALVLPTQPEVAG